MSYINVYPSRINWENEPNISTPINATNLNKADYALYAIDQTLAGWDTSKADESDLLLCIKTIDYDTSTGVFVFTWQNGTTKTIDLNIEKIPVSFSMDANGVITMTTDDGTTYTADVGALIKTYTFTDSAVIDFTVTTDASGNKTVTADIVDGSITGQKLQPNYLADCQTAATNSSNSATAAASSKGDSEAWAVGTRGGVPVPSTDPAYQNNSYWWSQHGASNSLAGLTDTDITNPTSGQTIIYDTTDAKWKNGSAVGGGSTIVVTTTETTLYGQNVTITDGTTTLTETFDNTGVATFKGVTMTGNLTIASGTTSTSLNIPYFGNYTAVLSSFSASITVTYPNTASCTCTGNGESYTASGSPYTFTVHGVATYTITTTLDGVTKTDTVIITTDGQTESVTVEYGTINLTYADDFRGQTVNCVNGGTTITKTAPSSGNTMVFYPPTTGTWVISSTVSGSTYTVNAVITSLSTPVSVTLNAIPNGSTVTPTDDIQIWLACAGITDKAYTTLAEVLADTDTYTTLLGDSNACDYMARSTTWAIATGQVPTMTSDNTPSGECFGTTATVSNPLWKAFDGDNTTYSELVSASSVEQFIGYKFTEAKIIKRFDLLSYHATGAAGTMIVKLYGSNDNSTWTPLYTKSSVSVPASGDVTISDNIDNDTAYLYYRLGETPSQSSKLRVKTLQLYDADITNNADAMRLLGMYNYACDALLSDSTWASAIANSTYYDSVLDVKVPTMTSATSPSGQVFASSENSANNYNAWKAFDGSDSTFWGTSDSSSTFTNIYVGYTFTEATVIASYYVKFNTSVTACTYKLQGSNDGTNWTDIGSTNTTLDGYTYVTNDTAYTSYRLFIVSETLDSAKLGGRVLTLQFYGRHSAQTDVIHSAPSDTIYYLDNGNPVTLCTTDASGVGTVDWSDLPTGDITLYSSVAKNPTDLTADYSKTIKVTKNKVDGYLMPDNTLYWYGWKSNDTVPTNSANGWSYSTYTYVNPSYQTNYVGLTGSASTYTGIASKNLISSGAIAKCVCEGVTKVDSIYGSLFAIPTKAYTNQSRIMVNVPQELALTQATLTANAYVTVGLALARSIKCYALWYE